MECNWIGKEDERHDNGESFDYYHQMREDQLQRELEAHRQKELEAEQQRELEAERQREIDAQRQREIEAERERLLEEEREREREAQREIERRAEEALQEQVTETLKKERAEHASQFEYDLNTVTNDFLESDFAMEDINDVGLFNMHFCSEDATQQCHEVNDFDDIIVVPETNNNSAEADNSEPIGHKNFLCNDRLAALNDIFSNSKNQVQTNEHSVIVNTEKASDAQLDAYQQQLQNEMKTIGTGGQGNRRQCKCENFRSKPPGKSTLQQGMDLIQYGRIPDTFLEGIGVDPNKANNLLQQVAHSMAPPGPGGVSVGLQSGHKKIGNYHDTNPTAIKKSTDQKTPKNAKEDGKQSDKETTTTTTTTTPVFDSMNLRVTPIFQNQSGNIPKAETDGHTDNANFISKWFYHGNTFSRKIKEKMSSSQLIAKTSTAGFEKIDVPHTIQRFLTDIGMPMDGIDTSYIKKQLDLAKQKEYKAYKLFKESLKSYYGEPKVSSNFMTKLFQRTVIEKSPQPYRTIAGGNEKKKKEKKTKKKDNKDNDSIEEINVAPDVNVLLQCEQSEGSSIMSVPNYEGQFVTPIIRGRGRGRGRVRTIRQRGGRGSLSQPHIEEPVPAESTTTNVRGRGKGRGRGQRQVITEKKVITGNKHPVKDRSEENQEKSIQEPTTKRQQDELPNIDETENIMDVDIEPSKADSAQIPKVDKQKESISTVGSKATRASLRTRKPKGLDTDAIVRELEKDLKEINKGNNKDGDFLDQTSSTISDEITSVAENAPPNIEQTCKPPTKINLKQTIDALVQPTDEIAEDADDHDMVSVSSDTDDDSDIEDDNAQQENLTDIETAEITAGMSSEEELPATADEISATINRELSLESRRLLNSPRAQKLYDRIERDADFMKKISNKHWAEFPNIPENPSEDFLQQLTLCEYKCSMGAMVKFDAGIEKNEEYADDNVAFAWNALLANKGIETLVVSYKEDELEITYEDHMDIVTTVDRIFDDPDWEMYESHPEKFTYKKLTSLSETFSDEDKEVIKQVFEKYQLSTLSDLLDLKNEISTEMLQNVGAWQGEPLRNDEELTPSRVHKTEDRTRNQGDPEAQSSSDDKSVNFFPRQYNLSNSTNITKSIQGQKEIVRPRTSTPSKLPVITEGIEEHSQVQAQSTSQESSATFSPKQYHLSTSSNISHSVQGQHQLIRPRSSTPQHNIPQSNIYTKETVTFVTSDAQEFVIPVIDIDSIEGQEQIIPSTQAATHATTVLFGITPLTTEDIVNVQENAPNQLKDLLNISSHSIEKVESWMESLSGTSPKKDIEMETIHTDTHKIHTGDIDTDSNSSRPSSKFCVMKPTATKEDGFKQPNAHKPRSPKRNTERQTRRKASMSTSKMALAPPPKTSNFSDIPEQNKHTHGTIQEQMTQETKPEEITHKPKHLEMPHMTQDEQVSNDKREENVTQKRQHAPMQNTIQEPHVSQSTVIEEQPEEVDMDTGEAIHIDDMETEQEMEISCDSTDDEVVFKKQTLFDLEPSDMGSSEAKVTPCESIGTVCNDNEMADEIQDEEMPIERQDGDMPNERRHEDMPNERQHEDMPNERQDAQMANERKDDKVPNERQDNEVPNYTQEKEVPKIRQDQQVENETQDDKVPNEKVSSTNSTKKGDNKDVTEDSKYKRPHPIIITGAGGEQAIERSFMGKRRINPDNYMGIPIKPCVDEERSERATPEVEKGQGLDMREMGMMIERAATANKFSKNNHIDMYIEPSAGDIYLFDLPHDQQVFKSKKALSTIDPYVWKNNGVARTAKRGTQRTYYRNEDYDGNPTDFEKRITIHMGKRVAVVEYLNSHTTGKTSSDMYFENAVRKYQTQEKFKEKNSKKQVKTKITKATTEEQQHAQQDVRHEFDALERKQEIPFEKKLQSALQPLLPEGKVVRTALPALTDVTPPGVALSPKQIHYLLEQHTGDDFMDYKYYSIVDPKDGELYLFDVSEPSRTAFKKHIGRDTYRWKSEYCTIHNKNRYMSQQSSIKVLGEDGKVHSNAKFKRYTYTMGHTQRVVVHYTGNNSVRARYKHGNSKDNRVFIPTSQRVQELIEEHGGEYTREVLLKSRGTVSHGLLQQLNEPRNANQIRYENRKKARDYKLTLTEGHNAQVLADYWGESVVRQIVSKPSTSVIMLTDHTVKELAKVTSLHPVGSPPMVFHYDTTFNCGSHFVSTLSLRHDLLRHRNESRKNLGSGEPTIPIAFMIHDKRVHQVHTNFFRVIDDVMNNATKGEFRVTPRVVVSDLEFKEGIWDDVKVVHCWRHLSQNIERYVKTNGYNKEEGKQAINSFFKLAHSTSEDEFKANWGRMTTQKNGIWASPQFVSYMRRVPCKSLQENAGKWYLQQLNMEHIENGMTNNAAEGVNNALKSWLKIHQRQKRESNTEIELYMVMQACKNYNDHEMIKVTRAYYNSSDEYRLASKVKQKLQKPQEQMPPMPIETAEQTITNINVLLNDHPYRPEQDDPDQDPRINYTERKEMQSKAQGALKAAAKDLLAKKKFMDYIPHGKYYKIIDEFDRPFTVYLNDNTCSCSTKGWCAHLLAVREQWGVGTNFEVPLYNVNRIPAPKHPSTLRKHKTGSKKPAPQDTFNDMFTVRPPKSNKTKDTEQQLVEERTSIGSDEESANTTDVGNVSQYSSENDTHDFVLPKRTQTRFHKMTQDIANGFREYSKEEMTEIYEEEIERVNQIKKKRAGLKATIANTPNQNQFAVASAGWDIEYIDRRMNRQSFEHNHAKLEKEQSLVVTLPDGQNYAFLNRGNQKVIVYGNQYNLEAMRFGARAVQHVEETITVEFLQSLNPTEDCEKKTYDKKKTKLDVFTTQCHCREPVSMIELNNPEIMMPCTDDTCTLQVHKKCVDAFPEQFKCAMHTLPFPGMKWSSGNQFNTCTVDNFYTAVTLECIKNPGFQMAIAKTKYSWTDSNKKRNPNIAKALDQAIEAAKAGDYATTTDIHSKLLMAKYPEQAETLAKNLEGTEHNFIWEIVKDGGKFIQADKCTKCRYTTNTEPKDNVHFLRGTYPPLLKYEMELGNNDTTKCPKCPNGIMGGVGLQIPNKRNPPWFLHLEVDTSAYRIREMTWLPKTMKIEKEEFKLAYITLQTPNHFKAIINHDNQFLLYDGNSENRFRWLPADMLHQDYSSCLVQGITYFRDVQPEV